MMERSGQALIETTLVVFLLVAFARGRSTLASTCTSINRCRSGRAPLPGMEP